ncbi:MAG: DUF4040 domain-containing protein [Phycisphaeraceae bacterium]|nr:DUF4040 domain-containing protein [Phycisphaeraceae bacterium]
MLLALVISGFVLAPVAPMLQRALPHRAGYIVALLPLAIAVMLGLMSAGVVNAGIVTDTEGGFSIVSTAPWVAGLGVDLAFRLDGLGLLMAMLVSGIGALIFVYAAGYLHGHKHLGRLYAFLLMFMASMLGVVLADNLILLFVFWELTSVSSYLLIGFDHSQEKSRKSALQALLVTGLGGLGILAAAIMLGDVAGTFTISELVLHRDTIRGHALFPAIVVLMLFGACTKSAQFPFHFWLPNAMAAPTPVSAYLHSSTMVKAGVYLIARLSPVLGGAAIWNDALTWIGATTMVVGAWMAFRQRIMKPLLAYSTVSALGTLVMALGVGTTKAVEAAMVFLLAHAFYKGTLFMAAGAIDHETGEKDVSKLSGLRGSMPILFIATAAAALSMAGLPPFVGFVAKELMLKGLIPDATRGTGSAALTTMLVLSSALGVVVAVRFGIRPFLGDLKPTPTEPHEPPRSMLLGPVMLASLGLLAVVLPGFVALPLVGPAASAVLHATAKPDMALWHGVNAALLLSVVVIVAGAALFAIQSGVLRVIEPIASRLDRLGPARVYDGTLWAVLTFSRAQTRALQSGSLRQYIFFTIGTAVIAIGGALAVNQGFSSVPGLSDVRNYEIGLFALLLVGAGYVGVAKNRLAAIAGLGLVGYGIALAFVLFGAPDLALTQLCIETLMVVLMVLVFYMLPDFRSISNNSQRFRDLFAALSLGAVMFFLVLIAGQSTPDLAVTTFYGERSVPDAYGRNVVNVILVDFRALDTLGEITVLVVAAVGVYALLKSTPKRAKHIAGLKEGSE